MSLHKNQPKGLFLLFFVEMWERFAYYGMRALLVLYMVKVLLYSTEKSGQIYGWYTGMVYLTPLLGGYIADRYLGQRKCIVIGAILMAMGEFALAVPNTPFFFGALILLIIGNGFFKPNISTVVGSLYEQNDPRRDGGFTIFYMGINLGALFSPLICGTLADKVGWGWGFASAGAGMTMGLAMYLWGQKAILGEACNKPATPDDRYYIPLGMLGVLILFLLASALQHGGIPTFSLIPNWLYAILGLLLAGGGFYAFASQNAKSTLTQVEKQRIAVIFIMVFFSVFFWSAFEQAGSSLTLFADLETNRMISIFGWNYEMPASYFQSVNPLFIILLTPLFAKMWVGLGETGKEPSSPVKFVIALGLLALGFVVMIAAAASFQQYGKVSMLWLIGAYLLHTLGELCLSPVGLSLVTKLAPAQFGSLMMGVWLMSSAAANYVGGYFAGNYDAMNHTVFYMVPTATAAGSALLLLLITPKLKKWMHGIN